MNLQIPATSTAEHTLAAWLTQSAEVRTRMLAGGGQPGLARPEQVAGKTGLKHLSVQDAQSRGIKACKVCFK